MMFFTNTGRVYRLKGYEIPEAGRTARGTAIINLLQLQPEEKITAIIPIKEYDEETISVYGNQKGSLSRRHRLWIMQMCGRTGLAAITSA